MKRQNELLRSLRKELAAKERELANQKWVFEQFLQSPTWRWTSSIRWVANQFRKLRNGQAPSTDVTDVADIAETPGVEEEDSVDDFGSASAPAPDVKAVFSALGRVSLESFLSSGATLELPNAAGPTVSIVLVLFNRAELTLACMRSIAEVRAPDLEVIIADNASSDETPLLLDRVRGARIIRNTENRHYLLAVNQAVRTCRGEYILLLNNDAQLLPGTLQHALGTIRESSDIGAVGGKIILLDGTLQEAGSIVWRDGSCLGYGRGDNPFAPSYMFRRDVDYCSGAFLLTPRRVWEQLGGFDEIFKPAYYEETDYCFRLWQRGLRVVYEPRAAIVHYEFGSSESVASATGLQARHQGVFAERHRGVLDSHDAASPDRLIHARLKHEGHKVLFLDDRVPHLWLGSGFPRANALLRALLKHGCFVTLYPLAGIDESWDLIYSDVPREVEVMMGHDRRVLESFVRNRAGYYTTIFVSRPHNMGLLAPIAAAHPDWFEKTYVVYDAEALFVAREAGLRELAGNPMSSEEILQAQAREIALTATANCIVSVSEGERSTFLKHGITRVDILGHSIEPAPTDVPFEQRDGLLFVGAVHEEDSPNADSLIWFLTEIFPLIQTSLGSIRLTVAGVNKSQRIRALAGPSVEITGHLPALTDLYAQSRLLIAPTRYAAGIPHKVHEAAANGLPVVATPLLAAQLGWTDAELAIAKTAEAFAARCIETYTNSALWLSLRNAALNRVRLECSPRSFEEKVGVILENAKTARR